MAARGRLRSKLAMSAAVLFIVFIVTGLLAWRARPPEPPTFHLPISISDVVIVRESGQDRVLERDSADRKLPTYEVNLATHSMSTVSRTLGFDSRGSGFDGSERPMLWLGLFRMSRESQYSLFAYRLYPQDKSPHEAEIIPQQLVGHWHRLIVEYLNANRGGELVGDALERVLSTPQSRVWWFCWQNVCVLAAWLSLAAALVFAIASVVLILFGPRRQRPVPQTAVI